MIKKLFLVSSLRCLLIGLITAIGTFGLLFLTSQTANAEDYSSAKITGYAFGYTGADPDYVLTQYDFANHQPGQQCPLGGPEDPTGDWLWGTAIRTNNAVTMRNQQNQPYTKYFFYLHDNGDPNCNGGPAWADLHFGRWKDQYQGICTCTSYNLTKNSCDPGFNSVNNCSDALNFGIHYGYTK